MRVIHMLSLGWVFGLLALPSLASAREPNAAVMYKKANPTAVRVRTIIRYPGGGGLIRVLTRDDDVDQHIVDKNGTIVRGTKGDKSESLFFAYEETGNASSIFKAAPTNTPLVREAKLVKSSKDRSAQKRSLAATATNDAP